VLALLICSLSTSAWAQEPDPPADPPLNSCGHTPRPEQPEVNIRGTETFIAEFVGDNGDSNESSYGDDDDYFMFRNLLYLQAGNRYFDSGIRLDTTFYQGPPVRVSHDEFVAGGSGYTTLDYGNDWRIERIYGTAHVDNLHVTAGDFYVSFGRGLVLSLIKLDDVGVDNALRGARVEYRVPRMLHFVLVGGVVNSLNIDPITRQVQEDDPLDRIVGARGEWEIADALSLGVHGVFMRPRFEHEADIDPERLNIDQGTGVGVLSGGGSFEMHLGGAHLYLEGNAQTHDNYRAPEGQADVKNESGYAAFGEFSYDLSPFNIKAEGIYYKRWLMEGPFRGSSNLLSDAQPLPYHHMVTLEPLWMVIKSFGNTGGGRLTGDLYLKEPDTQLILAASTLYYMGGVLPQGDWHDHPKTLVVHPTLEVRQGFGESGVDAGIEGGFRYETTEEPEPGAEDSGTLWHAEAHVSVPITGPHSVEAKFEIRRHQLQVTEGIDYWITLTSLGYDLSGLFGVVAVHEYSDQTAGERGQIGALTLPFPRKHYVWLMGTLHPPAPLDGLTFRLLAGSQRGGIKCAGGVCRNYPDAVGAKLEAVYRF
jgi:hypothetical protein